MKVTKHILSICLATVACIGTVAGQSEQDTPEETTVSSSSIMMRGEVHDRMVLIRWAPTDARIWKRLNQHGVKLERLTVVRDGQVLEEPELRTLSDTLKPRESEEFMSVATQYSYGGIIAQAVFGEDFVVSNGKEGDIETIIAVSEELQQRFAMSLYAADMCFPAAVAVGWGFEDLTVRKNEKYLYRVIPLVPDGEPAIEHGALFVDMERLDRFPAPLDFAGKFSDGSVMLSWNARVQQAIYAAYIPERSTNGKSFTPITETPITKMDDSESNDQIFYADSIQNNVKYYYRLVGLTPFGSKSEVSKTISGIGLPELRTPAFITKAVPNNEGGAEIEWEFDNANESLIDSFTLERSDDNKDFSDYISRIDKRQRSITAPDIRSTNYFSVTANTITGRRMRSFTALVQPVDTLPPIVPVGLRAIADTTGVVKLTWQANKDKGRFGYRIYRGQTAEEELIPINDVAHRDTVYVDSINLRTLNRRIYYAVTALDERYNQSSKSALVEVKRPEIIPPTPPLITRIDVENGKNIIIWVSGQEETLVGYDIRRQRDKEGEFELIISITGSGIYQYEDTDVENNGVYTYRVMSRSEGGLVSNASPDYRVTAIKKLSEKNPAAFELTPSKDNIRLSWNVFVPDVVNVQLYKKREGGNYGLMADGLAAVGELKDADVAPGMTYGYMLVVKSNGAPPVTIIKSSAL